MRQCSAHSVRLRLASLRNGYLTPALPARGMVPSLGESLSVFIALAPAVYAGPLTRGFPFTAIKNMPWKTWRRIFGVLDYIPVMRWSYDLVPGLPFALLGYQVRSAYIFAPKISTEADFLLADVCVPL